MKLEFRFLCLFFRVCTCPKGIDCIFHECLSKVIADMGFSLRNAGAWKLLFPLPFESLTLSLAGAQSMIRHPVLDWPNLNSSFKGQKSPSLIFAPRQEAGLVPLPFWFQYPPLSLNFVADSPE